MSLLDLRKLEARAKYPNGLDEQELRESNKGLIMEAKASNLLDPSTQRLLESNWGVPSTRIPVMSKNVGTVTDGAMDCDFSTSEANATFVDVSYIKGWIPLSLAYRAESALDLDRQTMFNRLFKDAELAIVRKIETEIYTLLDNAKATTSLSPYTGAGALFPFAGDALQVSSAQRSMWFNYAKNIMQQDAFYGEPYRVIANTSLIPVVNEYVNQGSGNNTNTAFQFNGLNFGYSNDVTVTAATSAISTGFIMPPNSIAYHSRVSPEARDNKRTSAGKIWDTYYSEALGLELELMYNSDCADVQSWTGNADDIGGLLEQWKIGYNIALLTPYNTGTNGGIKKFDILP